MFQPGNTRLTQGLQGSPNTCKILQIHRRILHHTPTVPWSISAYDHGPPDGQLAANPLPLATPSETGIKKPSKTRHTSASETASALSFPFRTNASHCRTFVGSVPNSSVSASGGSSGTGVRRRANVAATA